VGFPERAAGKIFQQARCLQSLETRSPPGMGGQNRIDDFTVRRRIEYRH
jgi:hypothetical protein